MKYFTQLVESTKKKKNRDKVHVYKSFLLCCLQHGCVVGICSNPLHPFESLQQQKTLVCH